MLEMRRGPKKRKMWKQHKSNGHRWKRNQKESGAESWGNKKNLCTVALEWSFILIKAWNWDNSMHVEEAWLSQNVISVYSGQANAQLTPNDISLFSSCHQRILLLKVCTLLNSQYQHDSMVEGGVLALFGTWLVYTVMVFHYASLNVLLPSVNCYIFQGINWYFASWSDNKQK